MAVPCCTVHTTAGFYMIMPCFLAFDFDCMGALVFPDYSPLIPVKMQGVEQRIRREWRGGAWAVAVLCCCFALLWHCARVVSVRFLRLCLRATCAVDGINMLCFCSHLENLVYCV